MKPCFCNISFLSIPQFSVLSGLLLGGAFNWPFGVCIYVGLFAPLYGAVKLQSTLPQGCDEG